MTETIQQLKEDIAILQEKLQKLEELQRTKSPAEEAFRKVYYRYPDKLDDKYGSAWDIFEKGYNASQEPEDNEWKTVALGFGENLSAIGPCGYYDFTPVEWYDWVVDIYENTANEYLKLLEKERARAKAQKSEKEQQIKELVRESVKWCEEHREESVEDYLRPKTPEQTEKSLKEAFVKAQQTEKWKEIQKLIDEEDNDKNFKNSLDLIRKWGEKNKPPTLKELLWEWWEDIFTRNSDLDADASIDYLVDIIDKKFIPPSSDRNGYEWEKCLKIMRDKLR
jgi:hypothetical protein